MSDHPALTAEIVRAAFEKIRDTPTDTSTVACFRCADPMLTTSAFLWRNHWFHFRCAVDNEHDLLAAQVPDGR